MDLERNKNSALVGVFIFTGLVLFISGLLLVGKQGSLFSKTINVSADFKDVNGLLTGNNVWFSGVKVGTVKGLTFKPEGSVTVSMRIEQKSVPYIHKDVKAKVSSDGLVGNKIIVLEGGSQNLPVIEEGDNLQVQVPLSNNAILRTLQENNKNLVAITSNLKIVTKRLADGEGAIGKLLTDDKLLKDIEYAATSLKTASESAAVLTGNLAEYSSGFKTKGTFANSLVTDTVIFNKLRYTVNQVQRMSENAGQVVENLRRASNNLNTGDNTAKVLLRDTSAAKSLKTAISNLESSSGKLNEIMDALQHSFLLRGYFKKKNK